MDAVRTPRPPQRPNSPPLTTPTTDFVLIESQKENIRPLASGRSAATLSTVFEKDAAADAALQAGHDRFRRDIDEAERRDREGEDMADGIQDLLDIYNQYVLFTVQHHPSSDTHLVPLLESTTRRFVADARYSQDVRYLKLWVMYTRHIVDRREDIWAFLESRDIGTRHAVFYEEWASSCETLGRKKKADEIYRLGIARRATPIERLKSRHQAFLARIMLPPGGSVPEDDPVPPPTAARTPGRAVLGTVASGTIAGTSQLAPAQRLSQAPNGAKMEVFTDENGVPEEGNDAEWAEFGTRDGRRKENTVDAGPWKGETMPQSAARLRVAPRTPKVEVFKDSGNDNEAVRSAAEVFTRLAQPPTEAELLKTDPLRHYGTTSIRTSAPDIPVLPAPPSARKPPRAPKQARPLGLPWECPTDGPEVKDSKGKLERRMFDWASVYKGSEEWSFEEVRARQRGLLGKEWKGDVKSWETAWHQPGSSTPKMKEKRAMPSPTVNTKLAAAEVAMMFDQTIHGSKIPDSDSDSEDGSGSDEEDENAVPESAPTPLPAPRVATISMLTPGGAMIPPTPTPAQGHISIHRPFEPVKAFADENAVPPSASKPKFNIFNDTPAKTPLAPSSSSKPPRAFGVFQEESPAIVEQTPRRPLSNNVFATPALSEKVPVRQALATAITEEEGNEEADDPEDEVGERVGEENEYHVDINDDPDQGADGGRAYRMRHFQVNTMTPITERTNEFTTRSSLRGTSVDADEALVLSQPVEITNALSAVVEEDERETRSAKSSMSPRTTHFPGVGDPSGAFDRSGSCDSDFKLPEGFTIHGQTERLAHTMVVVDEATTPAEKESRLPNPCNPVDDNVLAVLLNHISPPLSVLPGFHDHRAETSQRLESLNKYAKSKSRRSSSSNSRTSLAPEEAMPLDLAGKRFEVQDKIGEGGYGFVFLGVDVQVRQAQDDADSDDGEDDETDASLVAIKVEQPTAIWEAVVLDRLHRKLDARSRASIVRSRELYAFRDESFLLLDYSSQGTLLNIVNKASQLGIAPATAGSPPAVDELVAMFFTIELLRLVTGLHGAGFLHGDVKIDNCLVRLEGVSGDWSATYDPSGAHGWAGKGVTLIDFGRSVDLSLWPAGEAQRFVGDWKTDERDCPAMRAGTGWSWDVDYWGLAGVTYCLLFGKYLSTERDDVDGKWRISTPLKRYWQQNLWNRLFNALLNPETIRIGQMPISEELDQIRQDMEIWLAENCQKGGKSLKSMLKKIELGAVMTRKA
ncbi:hypothetical protein BCR39DRAFT_558055 [Naematelia encephala]|uniref:Mad3/BUB1 homology region 1-domain-containing protein n=1 Tax=Naematelia encephala TaxID=71784 RepID=A0A1Y2B9S6_9TREE|nr:hypothetical protein BCR39DRAFT_558055 [Naematelia encephala]